MPVDYLKGITKKLKNYLYLSITKWLTTFPYSSLGFRKLIQSYEL